jgi:hypothetical protein
VTPHLWLKSIGTNGVPTATQPLSTDLSDVVGYTAFTPTLSVDTMGDGVFSSVSAAGGYARIGQLVWFSIGVQFIFTYTTATGNFEIGGLPPTAFSDACYFIYALTPYPGAADVAGQLIGTIYQSQLRGLITGNAYIGNFLGPGLGLVSGTHYTIYSGGVYLGA